MKMDCVKPQPSGRHKDEEGVKVLHTKSQAGRTQKSRPPAASFERHLLGRTVKLGTACERGRTGRTGREETEHSYETLEPELRARCARTAHRGTEPCHRVSGCKVPRAADVALISSQMQFMGSLGVGHD